MHTFLRLARLSPVATLLLLSCISFAQGPAPRIRGPIEAAPSVTLKGSLDPHIRTADDLGPLAPDTRIAGVTLVFNRSAAQQADLDQLLASQTNPASPLFHHWLTPDEFAARFGVATSDIAAAQTWLQSFGFTLNAVSSDRIAFSGNAAQIQQAFGAELHRFRSRDANQPELHFAPAAELSLPPALAPVTAAVLHLSDFRPKPDLRVVRPDYTTLTSQEHFLAPGDIATLYDLAPLATNYTFAEGQSIAIVGQSFVPTSNDSAIYNFQTLVSDLNVITPIIVPGSGMEAIFPGDEGESDIDLEYSSGIATNANIFFVYTGSSSNYSVFDALAFAIIQDIAPVISVSYSACEPLLSTSDAQQYNALFAQAAAQGQTIVAASGDSGATACAGYSTSSGVSVTQQQALAAGFPASSPYVTAVGGTQMASGTFAAGANQYWATASVIDNRSSLLSYVPEIVWNESSSSFGIVASGGGASTQFVRPSWQFGVPGIPAGAFRLVPDIALQASVQNPGYLVCTDDPTFTGAQSDCAGGAASDSNGNYVVSGGTSFAAPIFAGFVAVLNQYQHTTGQGNVNPVLYSLAAQPSVYASAFHDIITGTTACAAGDGNCGTPGESSYAATNGYDMATGLGSVDFARLANSWPSGTAANLPASSVSFSSSGDLETNGAATAGASVTVTVNVNSTLQAHGFVAPTGTVSVSVDGQLANPSLAITAPSPTNSLANASFTFNAPSTTGSHIVIARYPGDAQHSPSIGTYTLLVGNVVPSGNFTLSAQNTTVIDNSTGSTQIAITPASGYSGSLTWSSSYTGGGTVAQNICYIVQPVAVNGPTTATMQIGTGTICSSPSGAMVHSTVLRSSLHPPTLPSRKAPAAASFLALLLFGLFPFSLAPGRRTRKLLPILSTVLLAAIALTLTGCGGGSSTAGGGGNPGPQVYTLTMTAKDSVNPAITASTSFTLTVD